MARTYSTSEVRTKFGEVMRRVRAGERVALLRPAVFQDLLWVLPGRSLAAEIDTALAAGYLRGADLWHVASALYLRADIPELEFLTLERAQDQVAAALGFPTP